jgi:ParB/RepB/Spo0J family partition protein
MDINIPEVIMLPRSQIRPNSYNPNFLSPEIFNELVRNIEEHGFLQPVIVSPLNDDPDGFLFEIVDGEHRFDGLAILDVDDIPCFIANLDTDSRKFLTVRMNKLRGKFDRKKFTALVKDLMERHSFDEVASQLAFSDPSELEAMIDNARNTLPTPEMKAAFDSAKKEIKTVDDLSNILNRIFTKYGNSLPANFMVFDFGGKELVWLRFDNKKEFFSVKDKLREILLAGYTADSFISQLLKVLPVSDFVGKYKESLVPIPQTEDVNIDDL